MHSELPVTITIGLCEAAPVRIKRDEWTKIGKALSAGSYIYVRQHADGRALVYGSNFIDGNMPRHGFLLEPGDDIARAVRRVAGLIGDRALGRECILSLPPVQL